MFMTAVFGSNLLANCVVFWDVRVAERVIVYSFTIEKMDIVTMHSPQMNY